jgi:hypothetical protein
MHGRTHEDTTNPASCPNIPMSGDFRQPRVYKTNMCDFAGTIRQAQAEVTPSEKNSAARRRDLTPHASGSDPLARLP